MPEICDKCKDIQKELETELKEGNLKEEDLAWRTCENCGYLCPVKKMKFSEKRKRDL